MTASSLWERFEAIGQDETIDALAALRLPGIGTHFLAKGLASEPVLLLRASKRSVPRIPLGLRHIQIEFDVDCAVRDTTEDDAKATVSGTFCRATCDPGTPGLHPLFVHALAGAAESLPSELTPSEADHFFEDAVELFRAFTAPARTSVLGLWGELFFIASAPCRETVLAGWHVSTDQAFDFTFPHACVEVKTTARHNRQHEFALTQLRGAHLPVFIASIVAERSDTGESVFDLASVIQEGLTPANRAKLWRLVAESVGGDAEEAGELRFLRSAAANSLRFYAAAELPTPEVPKAVAPCISAVRFSLDLDLAPTLAPLDESEVWQTLK
ncbi:PD-(D/E)XK motif protein [Candidatus Kaiserbacteria bacterium]|nr:PD-(D/E)XK motif protein [Candidatus Kaiserbacteria bacterium]